jgi:fido (protein-threonine AMPylation protein)
MAQFEFSRHHRAMSTFADLLSTLQLSASAMTVAELLALYPGLPRRTAQRWLAQAADAGHIVAKGQGRSRRYAAAVAQQQQTAPADAGRPSWAEALPLSADARDILHHVSRPLQARTPVGYQPDFLAAYQPNASAYLSEPLRRQLHQMGRTAEVGQAAGTYSRAILGRLLIDLSWASSHLEGNTYTRLDTQELIESGRSAQGRGAVETQMILNHKAAIELLVENIDTVALNRYTLLNLHSTLSENLLPNPADEGRLRQHAVDIGSSVYRPLSVPAQIEGAFDTLLGKAQQILDPFEQAFFMMVHLPYLQPFADMNKRTSRLAANLPLFRANLCPLTFLDVPESAYSRAVLGVYEMTRVELLRDLFVWAYERSTQEYRAIRQDLAEPDPLRLAWRDLIKSTVRTVVQRPGADALALIDSAVAAEVPATAQADVRALIVDELRRLHEGVLARYGLRPSEFVAWKRSDHGG